MCGGAHPRSCPARAHAHAHPTPPASAGVLFLGDQAANGLRTGNFVKELGSLEEQRAFVEAEPCGDDMLKVRWTIQSHASASRSTPRPLPGQTHSQRSLQQ